MKKSRRANLVSACTEAENLRKKYEQAENKAKGFLSRLSSSGRSSAQELATASREDFQRQVFRIIQAQDEKEKDE